MKKLFAVLALAFCSMLAHSQTTYTVTQDSCGGKAVMYCSPLPVVDQNGVASAMAIDNRNNWGFLYLYGWGGPRVHGTYTFPSGSSRTDFYGDANFVSDDNTVTATFLVHAHYVSVCSGRACGGTLGWHYVILIGSTVEVQ